VVTEPKKSEAVSPEGERLTCPSCGARQWVSVETIGGGSRTFVLKAAEWVLEADNLDLLQTTFRCAACGYEPEAGDDLWDHLNDLPTRP